VRRELQTLVPDVPRDVGGGNTTYSAFSFVDLFDAVGAVLQVYRSPGPQWAFNVSNDAGANNPNVRTRSRRIRRIQLDLARFAKAV
jgi:hypothetical protein